MSHVLAAIDFSGATDGVLKAAERLTRLLGGRLTLLHVAAADPEFLGYDVGPQTVRDARAAELSRELGTIHRMADEFQEHGIECRGLLVSGATVDTILSEARRFQSELIVLGSHGHGALYEALLGSVANGVVRGADCPVVLVPSKNI